MDCCWTRKRKLYWRLVRQANLTGYTIALPRPGQILQIPPTTQIGATSLIHGSLANNAILRQIFVGS